MIDLLRRFVIESLDKEVTKASSIHDMIDVAFSFRHVGVSISPLQVRAEAEQLLTLLNEHTPERLLEIGTARGGMLFLFCKIATSRATIVSVDLPGGNFGGGYPKWKTKLYESFAAEGQRICLLREDSHNFATVKTVEQILDGKPLDFLFIDGDHTYDGVKQDFMTYSRLVRKGGIVAFHDICDHPAESGSEVSKFWREIKQVQQSKEIINNSAQGWAGIGLLFL
jgi:predicted O-methyltransferase YrrM